MDSEVVRNGKHMLVRIVTMLTKMIKNRSEVREQIVGYGNENENMYGEETG